MNIIAYILYIPVYTVNFFYQACIIFFLWFFILDSYPNIWVWSKWIDKYRYVADARIYLRAARITCLIFIFNAISRNTDFLWTFYNSFIFPRISW